MTKLHKLFTYLLLASVFSVTVPLTTFAASISGLTAVEITENSAKITWSTDVDTIGLISFGTNESMSQANFDDSYGQAHAVTLSGLQPGTKYFYGLYVESGDSGSASSEVQTFTTKGASGGGTEYPSGTLAIEKGGATVYFLMKKDKVKIPFSNAEAFLGLGYKFSQLKTLDLSGYRLPNSYFISTAQMAHPWGSLTIWKDGTVYYMAEDGAIGIPSMEVLIGNGLGEVPIVPMNSFDEAEWGRNPNLPVLQIGDSRML